MAAGRSWLRSTGAAALSICLCVASYASSAMADGRNWFAFTDTGLGFASRFRDPKQCKDTLDEVAGEMTSVTPESWGASIGLLLGAAAGAVTTRSVFGAVRGGLLVGSIGSAIAHLAQVVAPNKMADLADRIQDLVQERDGKLCELIKASDKLRAPVMQHLGDEVSDECGIDSAALAAQDPAAGRALDRCAAKNPRVNRRLEQHASVLHAINLGTCHVAAEVVHRFDARLARRRSEPGAARIASLAPICDDDVPAYDLTPPVPDDSPANDILEL